MKILMRYVPFVLAFTLLFGMVPAVLGQGAATPISGSKAGKNTTSNITKAVKAFAQATDHLDSQEMAAVMTQNAAAQWPQGIIAPVKVLGIRNVQVLPDGNFGVDVTSSGMLMPNWYMTAQWIFVKQGKKYLFDNLIRYQNSTYVPAGMSSQMLNATLSGGQISIDNGKAEQTDIVFFHLTNQDPVVPVTVFRLHKGVKVNKGLQAKDLDTIGALFAPTGGEATQGFVGITPGTYIIVPVTQDANGVFPDPNVTPATVKVVAPTPKVTPVPEGSPIAVPVASPSASPTS